MKFIMMAGLAAATFSTNIFAQGGRTVSAEINRVFASANGSTIITLASSQLDNGGGTCSNSANYQIPAGAANANSGLATILTARALGAPVQLDILDCAETTPTIFNIILDNG